MGRMEEMQDVFARWRESGQSLRAFSRREGMAYTKLLYWRRKFREEEEPQGKPPAGRQDRKYRDWASVEVVPDVQVEASDVWFEIRVANGHTLRVPPVYNQDELRRLVLVLATC